MKWSSLYRVLVCGVPLLIAGCGSHRQSTVPAAPPVAPPPSLTTRSAAPATREAATLPVAPARLHLAVVDVRKTIEYLASPELEGRGVETEGLNKAADYIAATFKELGLRPLPGHADYFQPLEFSHATGIDPKTWLKFGDSTYKLKDDFTAASFSAENQFDAPVVFVGYGIASKQYHYDDYAKIDVQGKVALALRFEPHTARGGSRFEEKTWSHEATLLRKAKAAAEHGAVALLLVTPPTFHGGDDLMPFADQFTGERASIPVLQIKQPVADQLLRRGGAKDLQALQASIDETGAPNSMDLKDASVSGAVALERKTYPIKNVMAMLPGVGPHAEEYVVVGAHYDHLGRGYIGQSMARSHEIHPGADDNASGTAAVLKLAQDFANVGPRQRSLIFVLFTAEEAGLIGSHYFVTHPPEPLEKIVAMLNLDMVGRLNANHLLLVGGAGTAAPFEGILQAAGKDSPVQLKPRKSGYGPSDHMSFAVKKIPVLFFFTGLHADYHRPTDTADKINYAGIEQVVEVAGRVVDGLLAMPRSEYVAAADTGADRGDPTGGSGSRTSLGVIPDYGADPAAGGVPIQGVTPGTPAEQAGLKEGDIIIQLGEVRIDVLGDLSDALHEYKPGDKVKLKFRRNGHEIEKEISLAERK